MTNRLWAVGLLAGVLTAADTTGCIIFDNQRHVCTPGSTSLCACPGAPLGSKTCLADGSGYGACVCGGPIPDSGVPSPDATVPPTTTPIVTVTVVDSTFAPFKAGGMPWDGTESIPPDAIADLARIVTGLIPGAQPAVPIVGALANLVSRWALSTYALPDPFGYGELFIDGAWQYRRELATEDNNAEDRYFSTWPGRPHWIHVPLNSTARIRLTFSDCDRPSDADDMGTAIITADELTAALRSQRVYQVAVHNQTQNQVLAVGIQVDAE